MVIDKDFNLNSYLEYKGFIVKSSRDKRTNYYLPAYYDSWSDKDKEVLVTLHHLYGCNTLMTNAGLMMEISIEDDFQPDNEHKRYEVLYKGIQPFNFDDAEILFEMVLPSEKEYQQFEENFGFFSYTEENN